MTKILLEMEGTVEEIQQRLADFAGQRLHITLCSAEARESSASQETPRKQTIEEKLQALAAEIPLEEYAKLPPDLTDNLDYYIYGQLKK